MRRKEIITKGHGEQFFFYNHFPTDLLYILYIKCLNAFKEKSLVFLYSQINSHIYKYIQSIDNINQN